VEARRSMTIADDIPFDQPVRDQTVAPRAEIGVDLNAVRTGIGYVVADDRGIVGGVRDIDAVLAGGIDPVVLNRQIEREAGKDPVVPARNRRAAVVVRVAILDDDTARIAAIVAVAEDRNPGARRARDLEAVDGDEAARGELNVILARAASDP